MHKIAKIALGAAVTVTPFLATASSASASTTTAPGGSDQFIVGGSRAAETPWVVQLAFQQGGDTYGCTGEQLNDSWVLTARHCVDGDTAINVYHSNDTTNRGPATKADDWGYAPKGDVALVHLSTPHPLSSYPKLNFTYTAKPSGSAKVMGYGLRANRQQPDGLYQATVSLSGSSTDAYRGKAQHNTGVTGASNHGDSGGPMIVNGAIVAVCSTGDTADPGADKHAGSNYALISQASDWIQTNINQ